MFAFQDNAMFYSELFKDINKNFDQSKESKAKIQDNKSSWPVWGKYNWVGLQTDRARVFKDLNKNIKKM